jgi:integrase/recombinase XerD
MKAFLRAHLDWLRERNYSEETIRTRTNDIDHFIDWCQQRSLEDPTEVTQPILEGYQRTLYYYRQANGKPLSFRSQYHRLSSVRLYFRWLTRQHHTLFNPAAELEMPKVGKRLPRDILTAQEADWVIQQPDVSTPVGVRDRAMLETFYSTGVRRKELASLKLYDLEMSRRTLLVREGKGLKDRVIPIGQRALTWTLRYLKEVRPRWVVEPDEGILFLTMEGRSFVKGTELSAIVHKYIEKAQIGKSGGCHVYRHTMATLMLENGADIRYIQEMLGHSDLNATQVYTHVAINKLREIHRATHPAEQPAGDIENLPPGETPPPQDVLMQALEEDAQEEDDDDGA